MKEFASDYDMSKYHSADAGRIKRDTKFRVNDITEEPFKENGRTVMKPVLWFTTSEQGLVLNKTNRRILTGAFGDRLADWKNKVIVVYPTMTEVGGKMTPCLRVRIPPPKPAAEAPQQSQAAAAPQQPQTAAAPQQPVTSGNGAAAPAAAPVAAAVPLAVVAAAAPLAVAALAAVDPELEPDPVKPIGDEMDDEIAY